MKKTILYFSCTAIFLITSNVAAQDTKPAVSSAAPAAAVSAANIAKHTCTKPESISKLASDRQQKQFRKEVDSYRDCMLAYEKEMRSLAFQHRDAADAAIKEFNDYANSLKSEK